MFMVGISRGLLVERGLALLGEVPRHVGIDVVEHRSDVVLALLGEDAELFGFLLRGADGGVAFGGHRGVAILIPFADRDQMRLQSLDRIAERPRLGFVGRAVSGRDRRRSNGPRRDR